MAKILVTGAAGYIGSTLTPELLRLGHEVTALDNYSHNQPSLLECCAFPHFSIIRGDVRDKKLLSKHMENMEFIIPLAGIVSAPSCDKDPIAAKSINLDAIKLILELRKPGQKIIFPNTNSGYGVGEKDIYCDEKTPLRPISLYGQTKVDAERCILEAGDGVVFRLATVFGVSPRMRMDLLVNDFVYRAVYDRFIVLFEPHFKRNYIHVHDVARAFIFAINNFEKMKGEVFNVGLNDANLSKQELCMEIKKHIPEFYFIEATIGEDPDKRNYIVSNAKIEKIGYRPIISLHDGIRQLIKGYQILKKNQYANH